jgi:hypothetical protein
MISLWYSIANQKQNPCLSLLKIRVIYKWAAKTQNHAFPYFLLSFIEFVLPKQSGMLWGFQGGSMEGKGLITTRPNSTVAGLTNKLHRPQYLGS